MGIPFAVQHCNEMSPLCVSAVVLVAVVLVAVVLVALFDWAYKAGSIFITAVPVINASDIRLANTSSLGTFIVDYTCRSVYMHIVNVLMRIRSSMRNVWEIMD